MLLFMLFTQAQAVGSNKALQLAHAAVLLLSNVLQHLKADASAGDDKSSDQHHSTTQNHSIHHSMISTLPTLSSWLAAVSSNPPENPDVAKTRASFQLMLVDTLCRTFSHLARAQNNCINPTIAAADDADDAAAAAAAAAGIHQSLHSPEAGVWRVALARGAEGVLRGRAGVAQRTAALRMVQSAVECLGAPWLLEWVRGGGWVGGVAGFCPHI